MENLEEKHSEKSLIKAVQPVITQIDYMLGPYKDDVDFKNHVQWMMLTLKDDPFNIDIDITTAVNIAGIQKVLMDCLYDLTENNATYWTDGDKGQAIKKRNPSAEVYNDFYKLLQATYRDIGLTPKARLEFEKLKADAAAANAQVTSVFAEYMKNGLPE
ncbi:hypothetical protein [Aeromonas caviae]|uniref:hypothetical protein n=1 Tax=Aeromonas caviae TaxID=648 RepID=UPI002258DA83|nr:hypothetical protein [Aeromonas caviae]MCX4071942.1 hypothetical protein [Aeromonas caviae]HDT5861316.1 hypothetical protein [Aeromonas hydrophila subsp. hydrophila]